MNTHPHAPHHRDGALCDLSELCGPTDWCTCHGDRPIVHDGPCIWANDPGVWWSCTTCEQAVAQASPSR